MKLSARSKDYLVPEYSLTGDLLSFLTCNLQYRYQNKGTLPPSTPIQLWFGEFIHGIMEESFLKWNESNLSFPWDWKKDIRPIEEMIDKRLQARGLYPPVDFYCHHNKPDDNNYSCPDNQHPHKLLYSSRAEAAINIWGPHLFHLINNAELLIKGIRDMPNYEEGKSRSIYYSINGVIDVLSSLRMDEIARLNNKSKNIAQNLDNSQNITFQRSLDNYINTSEKDSKNKILEYLANDDKFSKKLDSIDSEEYEIIIDYKGMKRPSLDSPNWKHNEWQILTYSWLRSLQEDSKPIVGGIIFYLNELVPSTIDLISIQEDYGLNEENKINTDVKASKKDLDILLNWDSKNDLPIHRDLSDKFKMDRSIRIINIEEDLINSSLSEFDSVIDKIETATLKEIAGTPIKQSWIANGDQRTCDACDFRNFCNKNNDMIKNITVP